MAIYAPHYYSGGEKV